MAIDQKFLSQAERLALLDEPERAEILGQFSSGEYEKLLNDWNFWARPNQLAPQPDCPCGCNSITGTWLSWIILAGRGWGKTRTGAEWVHSQTSTYRRFHLVGPTASDIRDIMIEGPSGVLATQKSENKVRYMPTKRKLEWANGAVGLCFSADEPERLRGEQCEAAWADELAAWRYTEAWSQLQLGLRLGPHPQTVVTTTPRPTPLIKRLVKDPRNHVTKGSTFENVSNLADAFVNEITQLYEGTRFGRQELYAEILDDAETALWNRDLLELTRVAKDEVPRMKRIVVGVDPAISFGEDAAETGIVVCGLGMDGHAYVLGDYSGKYRPEQWARKVAAVYHEHEADKVIAEKNQGYDLVEHTIRVEDPSVPVKLVWAARNKIPRAEPISTAYEKGRAHHVGMFLELEEQMCTWEAGNPDSPDRLDAMVWAMTELIGKQHVISVTNFTSNELASESSYWKGLG